MRFLALASSVDEYFAGLDAAEVTAVARAEARRTWELYQAGIIRELSFRTDRRDVVMVLEAPDEATARNALASLPYAKAGGLTFEVVGLIPYDGWVRLFSAPIEPGNEAPSVD